MTTKKVASMQSSENTTGPFSVKLALLTAAVGAGFAGPAQAAFISTAGSGFTPITFSLSQGDSSFAIDLDQNGSTDFTILSTQGVNVTIQGTAGNVTDSFFGSAKAYSDTASFVSASSIKATANATLLTNGFGALSEQTPYAELQFAGADSQNYIGYINGTSILSEATSVFTLNDYGYDDGSPTTVPEPGSLGLLAAGAAGLVLLRRRRAERAV
jgi:hypothetical protein